MTQVPGLPLPVLPNENPVGGASGLSVSNDQVRAAPFGTVSVAALPVEVAAGLPAGDGEGGVAGEAWLSVGGALGVDVASPRHAPRDAPRSARRAGAQNRSSMDPSEVVDQLDHR